MIKRRNVLTVISLLSLPVLLVHFQNCAPNAASVSAASTSQGSVGLVDDLNKTQVQFASADVEIQSGATTVDISGLCSRDRNGASLQWALWSDASSTVPSAEGVAQCRSGDFAALIDQMDQLDCGHKYTMVLKADFGAVAQAFVTKRCAAASSKVVEAPEGSPLGTQCALEANPNDSSGANCAMTCYRDSKLVYLQAVDSNQCQF